MINFKPSGIKRKVLIVAIVPAATVTLLLSIFFSISQTQGLEQSLSDRGFAIIRQLGPASEYGMYSENTNILKHLTNTIMEEADVRCVELRNASGKVLVKSCPDMLKASALDKEAGASVAYISDNRKSWIFQTPIYQTEFSSGDLLDDEQNNNDTKFPILHQTSKILGWTTVELSLERTHAYQTRTWINTGLIAFSVLILCGVLAIRMGRKITEPIMTMKHVVEEIEKGNLDIEVNTGASGELRTLETGINSMAKGLKSSRTDMEDQIEQATQELRDTLKALEDRNTELDTARNEAETANKTKSAFLANISHEIRTPLNGIQGFLLLLSKTRLVTPQNDYLEKINSSTNTLMSLLNDILDFSKLGAAKIHIKPVDFDLRELLHESTYICVPEANNKSLELVVITDADIPVRLNGGADRISQIIKNLVSNAVKFTSAGNIVVHASLENKSYDNYTIRISVTDTGIGISKQNRERLFEPFSQIETGKDRRYSGTGLGLVITKSLVKLMGGSISVESIPERGSCFSVTLTLGSCDQREEDKTRLTILNNRTSFIVSENRKLNQSLQQTLKHWGINTEIHDNIEKVISTLQSIDEHQSPDTVLIDGMIEKSTLDMIINTLQTSGSHSTPCIIVINHAHNTAYKKFTSDNVTLITRPPHPNEIIHILCCDFTGLTDRRKTTHATSDNVTLQNKTGPLKILVADDNPINSLFLSTWLKQIGALVDEVTDGQEAIDFCKLEYYDLILMDLHMPRVDGIEAANIIRQGQSPSAQSPIVAITADATDNTKGQLHNSSLDDYLVKPVTEVELLHTLDKWCSRYKSNTTIGSRSEIPDTKLSNENTVVDKSHGLRLASGDKELWLWSLQTLAKRLPSQQIELEQAINDHNKRKITELAHSIVGASSYCGAISLHDAATQLEKVAGSGNTNSLDSSIQKLSAEILHLIEWTSQIK